MPRAADFPDIVCESNEVPTPTNPLGVKGAGEAGTVGALPAVVNAIVDALSPFGIDHIDMPVTSEKIWRALRDARRAS
jgi:carbon-monoxide dehydrogenase large subunit